jgi:hypothetical protein
VGIEEVCYRLTAACCVAFTVESKVTLKGMSTSCELNDGRKPVAERLNYSPLSERTILSSINI